MARFLIAPDSFKGTLSAVEVACHLAGGIRSADPGAGIRVMPLADGGDGTLEAIRWARGGRRVFLEVTGPLGDPGAADYLVLDERIAVVESALACGLSLVPAGRRDPMRSTTVGVGEMIRHAGASPVDEILVGTGGSATVDGGTGALSALGVRFLDKAGRPVRPGGMGLWDIHRAEVPPALERRFARLRLRVLCDVDNFLVGEAGAARTYGPQKGARPEEVEILEDGLLRFAEVTLEATGVDLKRTPGAGSAGGLAGALGAYLGGKLVLGAPRVMELVGFDGAAAEAEVIVTGEGRLDAQTPRGKVVSAVAERASALGIRCVAVAGRLGEGYESLLQAGIDEAVACFGPDDPDDPWIHARTHFRLSDIGRSLAGPS